MTSNPLMPSRDITELLPVLERGCREFLKRCQEAGLYVLVTQTYRSIAYQNSLYAQGRTTPGIIVTNAKGGSSPHNFRYAFDICRNIKGREYDNSDGFFNKCGYIWEKMGGEWGGNWIGFIDLPHMQYRAGFTEGQICAGAKIPDAAIMPWEQNFKKEEIKVSIDEIKVLIHEQLLVINAEKVDKIDNTPDSYAEEAVKKAVDTKVLIGDTNGNYMLHMPVTRQDMLVFLDRKETIKWH